MLRVSPTLINTSLQRGASAIARNVNGFNRLLNSRHHQKTPFFKAFQSISKKNMVAEMYDLSSRPSVTLLPKMVRPSPSESNQFQANPATPFPLGKGMVKKTACPPKFISRSAFLTTVALLAKAVGEEWFPRRRVKFWLNLTTGHNSSFSLLPSVNLPRFNVLTLQPFSYNHSVAFSDDTRERVRNANDIVDVIGSYLPLKRAGANFVALCPFHKEKTPSFNVNPHRQIFHCFGCHKGGDVFRFVMDYDSVDFVEALRRLADRAKIPLEFEKSSGGEQTRHLKEQLLQMHDQIAKRWQNALANEASGQIARDYLAKRGVSAEAIKLFRLGYAPDLWDDTVNWAKSKDHDLTLVEKGGLILKREQGDGYYDRFRGRLMFPISDEQGRVIAFSGRVLSGDEKAAKYVNSPETPIFIKSKVFFGLDKAKRAILDAGHAIICEGQLDMIACFMAGVQNIVAPQGTAFTPDHARIIKRFTDEVILCFDSDSAGQEAAVRALDSLLASGLAIKVATIPPPHDPDSFVKAKGGLAFKQLMDRADGFFDYYLSRLCATNETNSDKGRLAVLHAMAEAVHKTGNVVLIDTYAQKTALRLGVAPESVRAEFKKFRRNQKEATAPAEEETIAQTNSTPVPPTERWLLWFMLTNEELLRWIVERLDLRWIRHATTKRIAESCITSVRSASWTGATALLDNSDEETRRLVTAIVTEPVKLSDSEKTLKGDTGHSDKRGILEKLRDEFIDEEMDALRQRASLPETADEERIALLRKREELRASKKQPISVLPTLNHSDSE
jgi:DNA primase